jgi:hypothetical protein
MNIYYNLFSFPTDHSRFLCIQWGLYSYFCVLFIYIFPLSSVSRPALGPTQPPVQWVPGVLSTGVKRGRGVTLTIHHLVTRSGMSRSYTSSPPLAPSWRVAGQLFYLHYRFNNDQCTTTELTAYY